MNACTATARTIGLPENRISPVFRKTKRGDIQPLFASAQFMLAPTNQSDTITINKTDL